MSRDNNEETSQSVDDEGEDEENETKGDERLQVKISRSFGKFVGDDSGNGVAGGEERSGDSGGIADDHGNSHGFTQRAGESEKDRTHDAGFGKRNDDLPSGLPAGGTESQSGFTLIARNRKQHLAGNRNDVRNHHDGEDDARGEESHSVGGTFENRHETEGFVQSGIDNGTHERHDNKSAEQAVNDAGNSSEKIDEELQGIGDAWGSEFGKKDRGADAQGNGEEERNGGSDEGSVDEGEGAVLIGDGIPNFGGEEVQAELVAREGGIDPKLVDEKDGDEDNRHCKKEGDETSDLVAIAEFREKRA